MPATADTAAFGTPVEIAGIARELKKLWQADETRTRASLINFAIICEGEAAMQDSTELLSLNMPARRPSFSMSMSMSTARMKLHV